MRLIDSHEQSYSFHSTSSTQHSRPNGSFWSVRRIIIHKRKQRSAISLLVMKQRKPKMNVNEIFIWFDVGGSRLWLCAAQFLRQQNWHFHQEIVSFMKENSFHFLFEKKQAQNRCILCVLERGTSFHSCTLRMSFISAAYSFPFNKFSHWQMLTNAQRADA